MMHTDGSAPAVRAAPASSGQRLQQNDDRLSLRVAAGLLS
eukprot:CAMPEP_0172156768 /NCGR_PEP_ID=MMETSP1050-20130122/3410_1 /TAXON_ID=233186 /ORGANISM="Cryptomonas curvata, Strain CCAP979/52" /LENGTH=39 /DNA_ID= /DNA_START= /DNA_END= /DNA_ORIENTATION=